MSLGDIDVKHMASTIRPARKRGRPRNAAKALINDESIDVMALKPGNWKNTYVRHPQYLNGMCVDYRVVPNHKNEKLLRWQCRFSDAPDDILPHPKIVGFDVHEMKEAVELHRTWSRETAHFSFDCEDEM